MGRLLIDTTVLIDALRGRPAVDRSADCLVAAAAVTVGGRLATGNPRHFPMHELDVEHWPVGL